MWNFSARNFIKNKTPALISGVSHCFSPILRSHISRDSIAHCLKSLILKMLFFLVMSNMTNTQINSIKSNCESPTSNCRTLVFFTLLLQYLIVRSSISTISSTFAKNFVKLFSNLPSSKQLLDIWILQFVENDALNCQSKQHIYLANLVETHHSVTFQNACVLFSGDDHNYPSSQHNICRTH